MRAAWYTGFGKAEEVLKVGEFETPEPEASEVKIRVYASGVNPSDTKKTWRKPCTFRRWSGDSE